jgi:hypothetical protein
MLAIDLSVVDVHGKNKIYSIKVVRGANHPKLPHHFYYAYTVKVDDKVYTGRVVHNYNRGAIALTQKVTKAIVAKQKAERVQ